jgi:hypothetical protein
MMMASWHVQWVLARLAGFAAHWGMTHSHARLRTVPFQLALRLLPSCRLHAEPQKPVVVAPKPATTAKAPEKGTATAPVQKPAAQKQEKAATTTSGQKAATGQAARAGIGQFDTLSPLRPPINNPTNFGIAGGRR